MRKKILFLLLMLSTVTPAAHAQTNFKLKQVENMPKNFYLTQLDNGLEVLVIEDHTVPLATIEWVVKNGAFVQTPDLEGLAHLYEHMFFKANKDYPSQEAYLERVNELGIVFNGTTSDERVNYYVTLNKNKLTDGLQFMNSAARYPLFLKEEMERENVVVAGEFQRNESNPVFFLLRDMRKKLWGKEFSRKNTIGEYPVILNATPQIMQDIKDRYYYPNNSMMVIAGDVEYKNVFSEVQRIFGDWKPSTFNIFEKYPIPEFEPLNYTQSYVTENENSQIPILLLSWHGPDTRRDIEATYAADVFSYMLQQKNSKLQKALVETGLAYQVSVGYSTQKYTGPIQVFLVPNPAKVKEAIEELNKQIAMWDDADYYSDDMIATAKEMLEIEDQYGKEQTSQYVHTVTYWWASASLDYYTSYINNLKKVTRADIENFVKKYITGKPYISGLLVSPEMRKNLNIDGFYIATGNIEDIMLLAYDNKDIEFNDEANNKMRNIAELMRLNPDKTLAVTVYTANKKAGAKRSQQVVNKLKELGVAENRIKTSSCPPPADDLVGKNAGLNNTITFKFE